MKTLEIQFTDADYDLVVALATERGMPLEDFLRFLIGEVVAERLPPQPTAENPELVRDGHYPNPQSAIANPQSR